MARDLRNVTAALRERPEELLPLEVEQRRKLKKFVNLAEVAYAGADLSSLYERG